MENITLQTPHRSRRAGFLRPSFPQYLSLPAPSHHRPAASSTLIRACFGLRWRLCFCFSNYYYFPGTTCLEDHLNYSRDCYQISNPWRTSVAPGLRTFHPRRPRGCGRVTEVSASGCYLFFYSVFVWSNTDFWGEVDRNLRKIRCTMGEKLNFNELFHGKERRAKLKH